MDFIDDTIGAGEDLLKCLQASLGTSSYSALSLSPERWENLTELAAKAGLIPFFFRSLPVSDKSLGIPKETLGRWLCEHLASIAWNNKLLRHLDMILRKSNEHGIPVLLLKGIHLMDALYLERSMRTVGDIDLLIHPQDSKKIAQIMLDLGYQSVTSPQISDPVHCAYIHFVTRVIVEMHFGIETNTFQKPDIDGFWERSMPIEVNNQKTGALSSADQLFHLCMHLAHHLLSPTLFPQGLRSMLDIALLIQRKSDQINWEHLRRSLFQIHGERFFAISIMLVEKVLLQPLPAPHSNLMEGKVTILPADIGTLKKHMLLSCKRDIMDARTPKFMRSSVMADTANVVSGFFKRVFISRNELSRRYGRGSWYVVCWKYFIHFSSLIKNNFTPWNWAWGKETLYITKHFREIASLKERLSGSHTSS